MKRAVPPFWTVFRSRSDRPATIQMRVICATAISRLCLPIRWRRARTPRPLTRQIDPSITSKAVGVAAERAADKLGHEFSSAGWCGLPAWVSYRSTLRRVRSGVRRRLIQRRPPR